MDKLKLITYRVRRYDEARNSHWEERKVVMTDDQSQKFLKRYHPSMVRVTDCVDVEVVPHNVVLAEINRLTNTELTS